MLHAPQPFNKGPGKPVNLAKGDVAAQNHGICIQQFLSQVWKIILNFADIVLDSSFAPKAGFNIDGG